jgi:hypothetical protein
LELSGSTLSVVKLALLKTEVLTHLVHVL